MLIVFVLIAIHSYGLPHQSLPWRQIPVIDTRNDSIRHPGASKIIQGLKKQSTALGQPSQKNSKLDLGARFWMSRHAQLAIYIYIERERETHNTQHCV